MNRKTANQNEPARNGGEEAMSILPCNSPSVRQGGSQTGQNSAAYHSGLFNAPLYRVMLTTQRSETAANKTTVSVNQKQHMVISTPSKGSNSSVTMTPEGIYASVVKSINPVDKAPQPGQPPDVKLEFVLDGVAEPMSKTYPGALGLRSKLKQDAQVIIDRSLSHHEVAQFDTDVLLNRPCRVVVVHQAVGGGKVKAHIKSVLKAQSNPAATVVPVVAAAVAAETAAVQTSAPVAAVAS